MMDAVYLSIGLMYFAIAIGVVHIASSRAKP